jgi:hypothetical protein
MTACFVAIEIDGGEPWGGEEGTGRFPYGRKGRPAKRAGGNPKGFPEAPERFKNSEGILMARPGATGSNSARLHTAGIELFI